MAQKIEITSHLDWMSATLVDQFTAFNVIPPVSGLEIMDKVRPPKFFDKAWGLSPAGMVAIQEDGRRVAMLALTGGDLTAWRESGIADQTLIKEVAAMGANVTRVDYCVNVHGGGSVADCAGALERGERVGRPKPYGRFKKYDDKGDTLYFGSPQSAQRVTIYDKAAQLKLLNEAWVRVELRCRKPAATNLIMDMSEKGMANVGKSRLKSLVDFPNIGWYSEAMEAKEVELRRIPRKIPSTVEWLYNQVLPVFYKNHDDETARLLEGWLSEASIALRDNSNAVQKRPDKS